jgi:hypothetical protein
MAKLSDLVLQTSKVTGIPVGTVREISRRLREADLIQTGKGGRYGGAEMTSDDAASLLTALLIVRSSSVALSSIVSETESHLTTLKAYIPSSFKLLLGQWDHKLRLEGLCELKRGHTFGEAFSALIVSMSNGDFERAIADWASRRPRRTRPFFQVTVSITSPRPHPAARIEFRTSAFDRLDLIYLRPEEATKLIVPDPPRKWTDLSKGTEFNLRVGATVSEAGLASIGTLLGQEAMMHG